MKERPILFSAQLVRAILEGRKTQTRRVVKLGEHAEGADRFITAPASDGKHCGSFWPIRRGATIDCPVACPYGQPGDRLWVRETWAVQRHEPCEPHERDWQELYSPTIRYLADGATRHVQGDRATGVGIYHGPVEKSRPSIHMTRWASRITLEITDVRVQRVQDISEEDAIAEGIRELPLQKGEPGAWWCADPLGNPSLHYRTPRAAFAALWDSINAKRGFGWNANLHVWALTFKRVTS